MSRGRTLFAHLMWCFFFTHVPPKFTYCSLMLYTQMQSDEFTSCNKKGWGQNFDLEFSNKVLHLFQFYIVIIIQRTFTITFKTINLRKLTLIYQNIRKMLQRIFHGPPANNESSAIRGPHYSCRRRAGVGRLVGPLPTMRQGPTTCRLIFVTICRLVFETICRLFVD